MAQGRAEGGQACRGHSQTQLAHQRLQVFQDEEGHPTMRPIGNSNSGYFGWAQYRFRISKFRTYVAPDYRFLRLNHWEHSRLYVGDDAQLRSFAQPGASSGNAV